MRKFLEEHNTDQSIFPEKKTIGMYLAEKNLTIEEYINFFIITPINLNKALDPILEYAIGIVLRINIIIEQTVILNKINVFIRKAANQ